MSVRSSFPDQPRGGKDLSPNGAPLRLGRFELLMELSHGGMATLYLARMRGPQTFQKLVALKKIHDHLAKESEFVQMFLDEARIAAKIEHPNVASIYELGEADGSYYMAMEYVHGENLKDIIRASVQQRRLLPWTIAVKIAADTARGLHAAHELRNNDGNLLGVVHRDVSPQNILVSYEGHTKVIDFGVAYAAERISHTQDGTVKGKIAYMSPEQVAGKPVDRRSDIFSLGIVLFEALCFRRLFKKDSPTATMAAVSQAQVPTLLSIRSGLPPSLDRILHKALAVHPEDRFQTASDFAHALEGLLAEERKYLAQEDMASLVQTLFADKKAQRDEEIRKAASLPPGKPPTKSTVMLAEPSGTGFTGGTSFLKKTQSSNKALLVALIILGLGVVATGVYFAAHAFKGDSRRPAHKQKIAARADKSTPSSPGMDKSKDARHQAMVRVHVSVLPDGSNPTITVQGKKYRASDVDIFLKKDNQPVVIQAEAPGFNPKTGMVVPMKDLSTTIRLSPIKKVRVARPRKTGPRGIKDQWFKAPD